MKKAKIFVFTIGLSLGASAAEAGFFGSKIRSIHPGAENYFELDTENPHFRNNNCGLFDMGLFQASDAGKMERTYSAALAAMAADQDVIIWYDDNDPCQVDFIFVNGN